MNKQTAAGGTTIDKICQRHHQLHVTAALFGALRYIRTSEPPVKPVTGIKTALKL